MEAQRTHVHRVTRLDTNQPSFLLDAAAKMFLAAGFEKTSMGDIAIRAGVSKVTVYMFFRDKLELFHAVVRREAAKMNPRFDQVLSSSAHDTEEKLSRVALVLLETMTDPEYLAFMRFLVKERENIPEPLWMTDDFGLCQVTDVVVAILREDAAQHGYSVPELAAHASLFPRTAVAGVQLSALLDPNFRHDRTLLQENANWIAAVFLRGIRPRNGNGSQPVPPPPPA